MASLYIKDVETAALPSRDDLPSRLMAVAVLAGCAGLVAWLVQLGR